MNYLFIYFSLFKVGLHVVKNSLTNKYQRNKQIDKKIRFDEPLPDLVSNIKRDQVNQLSPAPSLKPSENHRFFDDFRGCRSQIIHSNSPNTISTI